jgi:hypothetical protein
VVKAGRGERVNNKLQYTHQIDEIRGVTDRIYKPTSDLEQNKKYFIEIVKNLL